MITASTSRAEPTPIAMCVASPYQGRKMSPCWAGTPAMNAANASSTHARPAAEDGHDRPGRASNLELGPEHCERHPDCEPVEQAREAHHQGLAAVVEPAVSEPARAPRSTSDAMPATAIHVS